MDFVEHRYAIVLTGGAVTSLVGFFLGIAYDSSVGGLLLIMSLILLVGNSITYVVVRHSGKLNYNSGKYMGEFKTMVSNIESSAFANGGEVALAEIMGARGSAPFLSPRYDLYLTSKRLIVIVTAGSLSLKILQGEPQISEDEGGTLTGIQGAIIIKGRRDEGTSADFRRLDELVRSGKDNFSAPYSLIQSVKVRQRPVQRTSIWGTARDARIGLAEVDFGKFGKRFGLTKEQFDTLVAVLPSIDGLAGKLTIKTGFSFY